MMKELDIVKRNSSSVRLNCIEELLVRIDAYIVELYLAFDPQPDNPREWSSNIAEFICFHNRYQLGDKHDYRTPADFLRWLETREARYYLVRDLYLYDHSGLTISLSPFSCPWDSGQIGWVRVDLRVICQQLYPGSKFGRLNAASRKRVFEFADQAIQNEVDTYDIFLRGDVFCYCIQVRQKLNETDYRVHYDLYDSLYNCFGLESLRYYVQNSMFHVLRSIGLEADEVVRAYEEICSSSDWLAVEGDAIGSEC